jgi:hypothetical protein
LNLSFGYTDFHPVPQVISTSLRQLIVRNASYSASSLDRLCYYTPNLQYLSIKYDSFYDQVDYVLPILSLTRLTIYFSGSMKMLEHLLQHMPCLNHLKVEIEDLYINGKK